MKVKNIISLGGVFALLMGLGLNLEYALDDYGLKSNSLNLFVLAQASTSGGGVTNGKQEHTTAHCKKTTTTTTTSGGSSSVGGNISAGGWGASGGVSATTGNTTTETTEKEFDAILLYCLPPRNSVETCVNFDPCE